ncbi:MAG: EF-hand domain-containing protein [Gammaproteobacteria bacterium]|nr:EF-hand domain-containing protein [Gammaproteobacteria bacterium]
MNLFRKALILVGTWLILQPLFSAGAQPGARSPSEPADTPDVAGSGPRNFSIHDTDQDGRISEAEYQRFVAHLERWRQTKRRALQPALPPLDFAVIDRNGDGYITELELTGALNERLERQRRRRYRGGRQ